MAPPRPPGMSVLPPGSKLGRFEISSVLGQGAMGVVYLAHDPQIERAVAIKTIHPEAARGESAAEVEARFLKEAKLAGRLQHPNVVTVYDVGRDRDLYFIAMEYVEGKPLTRYLGGAEELPLAAKVAVIRQAAEALAHAHERGVVHRDIKPGNILITRDGRVKVTDFGIGKFTSATSSDMTRTGQMIGSPAYMSPEQIRGEKIDGRSDLFSLGVVLYELLTGARPFPGESITTLVYQILHTEPRDPREIRSDLPMTTREVMARLLAKQPEKRPPDAKEFIRELRRIEKFQRESEMTRRAVAAAAPPAAAPAAAATPAPPRASREETSPATPAPPPAPPPVPSSGRGLERTIFLVAGAAIAVGVAFWLSSRKPRPAEPMASTSTTAATPASTPAPAAATEVTVAEVAVELTPVVLPTPGPSEAADAVVGATRLSDTPVVRRPTRVRPSPAPPTEPPKIAVAGVEAAPPPAPAAPARPARVDATYETRGSVRFTSSPEQARLYLDGRYVGIADDWDGKGGGRPLLLEKEGAHFVRMELPGYRPLTLQIDVHPDADDSISIDEELDRRDRAPYDKLPAVYDRTTAAVEFTVVPPDAGISEEGRSLGQASEFGPGSPLRLSGPMVHDLMLSAPGYKPKLVRILVAPNAGKELAKVNEKLKTP